MLKHAWREEARETSNWELNVSIPRKPKGKKNTNTEALSYLKWGQSFHSASLQPLECVLV